MAHSFEWIINAAANSKPSQEQLEQQAKHHAEYTMNCALTGWDGQTLNPDHVQYIPAYAEPGYTDPKAGVLLGNWNHCSRRVADLLEKAGYELEWEDEWTDCSMCYRAVRTSPDCYSWQRSYVLLHDSELICHECMLADEDLMKEWLEELENNHRQAVRSWVENGWHPGQDDDPEEILEQALTEKPDGKFLFRISGVGQFDVDFELWQKAEAVQTEEVPDAKA